MSESGERGNLLVGLLVGSVLGAAVGAGIALLLAPQSGRESRDWLARRAQELKSRVAGAFEEGKNAVTSEVLPV